MNSTVQLDEINKTIITILIDDARTSLKNIAKKCGISSVSVLNRIKQLRMLGVIKGATLFPAIEHLGFQIVATIGVENASNIENIVNYLKENTYLIEPSVSIGEYDLNAVIYAEDIATLNQRLEVIKRKFGLRKVSINVWSGLPQLNFNNIDLQPLKDE